MEVAHILISNSLGSKAKHLLANFFVYYSASILWKDLQSFFPAVLDLAKKLTEWNVHYIIALDSVNLEQNEMFIILSR